MNKKLLYLFIILNINLIVERPKLNIIDLPNEMILYIFKQNIKSSVNNVNNIFNIEEEIIKYVLKGENIKNIRLTCTFFNDLINSNKKNIYLFLEREKEKRFRYLFEKFKSNISKENISSTIDLIVYKFNKNERFEKLREIGKFSKPELNSELSYIINSINIEGLLSQKKELIKAVKLIAAGANPNLKERFIHLNILIYASYFNYLELVKIIINLNAKIDLKDSLGWTALMYSIASDYTDKKIIRLLANSGANVNLVDRYGVTPLIIAVFFNNEEKIEELVKSGANIDFKNENGITALIFAAKLGKKESVKKLLSLGADFELKDNYEKTAYDHVLSNLLNLNLLDYNFYYQSYKIARSIMGYKKSKMLINILKNKNASEKDLEKAVQFILKVNEHKKTKIKFLGFRLAFIDYKQTLDSILDKKFKINFQDKKGNTALIYALKNRYFDICKILIELGADITIPNNKNKTALDIAKKNGSLSLFIKNN